MQIRKKIMVVVDFDVKTLLFVYSLYFIFNIVLIMSTKLIVPKITPNFLEGVWGPSCKGRLGMVFAPGRFKPNQP